MIPFLPIVAVLALGGYLYSRKGTAAAPAGVPPYDVGLDPATAQAVAYAIKGGVAADGSRIPPETDPARVRSFIARLTGYPIAQAALTRYLATLGSSNSSNSSNSSSASSGTSNLGGGFLGSIFSAGGAGVPMPPAASSATPTVRDVRSAQAALVAWNAGVGAGAGADFGKQVASDVDGIAGPRTILATRAFQTWNNGRSANQLAVDGKLGRATYAALEPFASGSSSSSSSSSSFYSSITAAPPVAPTVGTRGSIGGGLTQRKF
jgi:hypothetical protein